MVRVKNIIYRICVKCNIPWNQDIGFIYLGDGVFQCHMCGCKFTEIHTVIDCGEKP